MRQLFQVFVFAAALMGDSLVAAAIGASQGTTRSFDIPTTELRQLLREVADAYHMNLVVPDSLRGDGSLQLKDVTSEQVFDVLLKPIGWTHRREGDVVIVSPVDKDRAGDALPSGEFLSAISGFQVSATKQLLRDPDFAEALADFHWNFFRALQRRGFTEEQALEIVIAVDLPGSAVDGQQGETARCGGVASSGG